MQKGPAAGSKGGRPYKSKTIRVKLAQDRNVRIAGSGIELALSQSWTVDQRFSVVFRYRGNTLLAASSSPTLSITSEAETSSNHFVANRRTSTNMHSRWGRYRTTLQTMKAIRLQ